MKQVEVRIREFCHLGIQIYNQRKKESHTNPDIEKKTKLFKL